MSGIPRKRPSLCCTECNRRKVKCDRVIPCQRCMERGMRESCTRAARSGTFHPPEQRFLDDLSQISQPPVALPSPRAPSLPTPSLSNTQSAAEHDEATNAATILEFLAWGKRKDVPYAAPSSDHLHEEVHYADESGSMDATNASPSSSVGGTDSGLSPNVLQLLLPERQMVLKLVDYHIECLLWYHGSFHAPTFQVELQNFYEVHHDELFSPGLDLQWVALLFAVLTGSISCGNKSVVAGWGFHEAEQEVLSKKWLQAVVCCLNAAQYMAKPSIWSCAAIATLTISAHILGYSNQQSILLASAVRIAQSLGLHRLDDNTPKSVDRELGRRVWSQLCSQDWFSIPFSECYLVHPLHSKTLDPINCDEETMAEFPQITPTVTSYCRYLHAVAALMPQLQDGIATSNTSYTKYEQVMKYDRKMRSHASEQRPNFLCNVPIDPCWPKWIKWARSAAAISSAHKIIMIHRSFLSASFTNTAFAFTRKTCIAASKTILKEVPRYTSEDGPVLWIFHAFTVAAGITLCLDALHRDGSDAACVEHCQFVEDAIAFLRQVHNSKIASRGVRILSDLLLLEKRSRDERGHIGSHKRKADDELQQNPREKRQRSIDMRDVVRDFQRGISPLHSRKETPSTATGETMAKQMTAQDDRPGETAIAANFDEAGEGGFLAADETLSNFHSNYAFHNGDAFGNLLTLAQTYSNS